MSTALIPNIILGGSLVAVIVAAGAWAIATAHRDHHPQFGSRRAERPRVSRRPPVASRSRGPATGGEPVSKVR
jgi:hypothetical protein